MPLQAPQNKADISAFGTTYTPLLAQLPSSPPKHCVVPDPNTVSEWSKQGTRLEATGRWQVPEYACAGSAGLKKQSSACSQSWGRQFPSPLLHPQPGHHPALVRHQELLPQRKRGQMETSSLAPVVALGREPCQPMCKLHAVWPSSACLIAGSSDRPSGAAKQ